MCYADWANLVGAEALPKSVGTNLAKGKGMKYILEALGLGWGGPGHV
jgi:hypothetical protein